MKQWVMKYKWWLLAALVLLIAIAVYFVLKKKKTLAQLPGLDAADDKLYLDMLQKLNDDQLLSSNPDNQAALVADALRRFEGTDPSADVYKIRGKLPKSGALLATIDAWTGSMRILDGNRLDDKNRPWIKEATRQKLWEMFSSYKITRIM